MKDKTWKIIVTAMTVVMAAAVMTWDVIEIVRCFRAGETAPGALLCAAAAGLGATVIALIRSTKDE